MHKHKHVFYINKDDLKFRATKKKKKIFRQICLSFVNKSEYKSSDICSSSVMTSKSFHAKFITTLCLVHSKCVVSG